MRKEKLSADNLADAIRSGNFEGALSLANSGVNATQPLGIGYGFDREHELKALDLLLCDHINYCVSLSDSENQKNYQTDRFTPAQRIEIFEALVANVNGDPMGLVSDASLSNALVWGRFELIPKLAEIGVTFGGESFVAAADPYHRKHLAIPLVEAVFPYVRDVNVINFYKKNAGHVAAENGDLKLFKWLEKRGLDKFALANINRPTYAHLVAARSDGTEFARHLVEEGYSLDVRDVGFNHETPLDVAFLAGNFETALIYIDGGAKARPEHLVCAVEASHYSFDSEAKLCNLIEAFDRRGLLNQKALKIARDSISKIVRENESYEPGFLPVVEALYRKGLMLSPSEWQHEDSGDIHLVPQRGGYGNVPGHISLIPS